MIDLTPRDVERYSKYGGCPYCKKEDWDIQLGDCRTEDRGDHYQEISCGDCGKEFVEIYRFVGLFPADPDADAVYLLAESREV